MSRALTSAINSEVAATVVAPAYFCSLEFASGTLRLWTGIGAISWNGNTYTGTGSLGGVSAVAESKGVKANGIELSLTGIPSELVSLTLSEHYRGRMATLWLAMINRDTAAILADPVQIFAGRMDTMTIEDSGDTARISVSVESRLIDLERARERRYTHADQQELYPGDLGLEYVAGLQDKEIVWGRESSSTTATPSNRVFIGSRAVI